MSITFRRIEVFDVTRFAVAFPADVNDKQISCSISGEALQDAFGAGDHLLSAFQLSRTAIEAKASELIRNNRFEADGTILISSKDFA